MLLARRLTARPALPLLLASLAALAACDRPAPPGPAGQASASASVASAPAAVTPPSASASGGPGASAAGSGASAAAGSGASAAGVKVIELPPLELIKPACCRADRVEGSFGPEKGINARYSGDYFHGKNGNDRLLFPDDLISDTQELYLFAKSAGKPLYQERRLRPVGESPVALSVEVEDRGETGATKPFTHSKCQTVDLRRNRKAAVADLLPKDEGPALLARAQAAFEASPGHEHYRFVPASFALVGSPPTKIRFCNPKRDEVSGPPRLDLELPWTQVR